MHVVHWAYDVGEKIFLVVAAVMATGALFLIARAPQIRSNSAQHDALEMQAENEAFCQKHGLIPGTHGFTTCELDLNDIRANDEKRQSPPW